MGNLTRDPELRELQSGTSVCDFSIAVNRTWKDGQGEKKEEVMFLECTAWGRRGEVIAQYFEKGKPIYVAGYLKFDQWEDRDSGAKRSKHKLTVDNFEFLGSKQGGNDGSRRDDRGDDRSSGSRDDRRPAPGRVPPPPPPASDFGLDEEDVPF
jgi:single-strand DNA-binding protein